MKASEAGLNPYAPGGVNKAMASPGHAMDPRAKGLDGDVIDQLLTGRWQEGLETGYQDGHSAAQSRYVDVFDDGFAQGQQNGLAAARAQIASELGVLIGRIQAAFTEIASKTGSEDVRAVTTAGLDTSYEIVEKISGVARQEEPLEQRGVDPVERPGMEQPAQ